VRDLVALVLRLAQADPDVAHALRAHFAFVEQRLRSPASPARARWLALVRDGAIFGNASTELGPTAAGAPTFATRLRADGDGFRLDGTKYYSTGSLYADRIAVVGQDEAGAIVSVVIPATRAGVTLEDDWDGIGQGLTGTGTTRLEAVRVEPEEVLRDRFPEGVAARQGFLQLYLTAVIAGIVGSAAADAVALVRGRARGFAHAAGPTPATDPLLQQVVGEIAAAAYVAEAAVLRAAGALDREAASVTDGVPDPDAAHAASLEAAQAKVVVDALAQRATSRLFDAGGAAATRRAADLDRHWRNVRTIASHNPAADKARAIGDHAINGTPLPANWFF
jgi:alkylation response protein AidB-like acyl-CoA dehydrogenase